MTLQAFDADTFCAHRKCECLWRYFRCVSAKKRERKAERSFPIFQSASFTYTGPFWVSMKEMLHLVSVRRKKGKESKIRGKERDARKNKKSGCVRTYVITDFQETRYKELWEHEGQMRTYAHPNIYECKQQLSRFLRYCRRSCCLYIVYILRSLSACYSPAFSQRLHDVNVHDQIKHTREALLKRVYVIHTTFAHPQYSDREIICAQTKCYGAHWPPSRE